MLNAIYGSTTRPDTRRLDTQTLTVLCTLKYTSCTPYVYLVRRIDGRVHDTSHLSRRTSTYGYAYACRHVIILYAVSTTQVIHTAVHGPSSSSTFALAYTCTFEITMYNIILYYVIFIMRDDERRFVYSFGGIINRVYYIMCCTEAAHDDDSVKRLLLLLI